MGWAVSVEGREEFIKKGRRVPCSKPGKCEDRHSSLRGDHTGNYPDGELEAPRR